MSDTYVNAERLAYFKEKVDESIGAVGDILNTRIPRKIIPIPIPIPEDTSSLAEVAVDPEGRLWVMDPSSDEYVNWDVVKGDLANNKARSKYPLNHEFTVRKAREVAVTASSSNQGVTSASIDESTFLNKIKKNRDEPFEFIFNGSKWVLNGTVISDISEYGVTVTGSPVYEDKIVATEACDKIVFCVKGYDYDPLNELGDKHNMVLVMKHAYSYNGAYIAVQFDAKNAFFTATETMPAGTYWFNVPTTYSSWLAGDYHFTIQNGIAAGAQFVLKDYYTVALTSTKVLVYSSWDASSTVEECNIIEGQEGTELTSLNHFHRANYGSNNYYQSNVRAFLESDVSATDYYMPHTIYQRRPSNYASTNKAFRGFRYGLDADFIAAASKSNKPCRTSNVFELDSNDGKTFETSQTYTITDKFFLLSRPEMYGTYDSASIKDGELLDGYSGLEDLERIVRDENDVARGAWLRSPYPSNAYSERNVYATTGVVGVSGSVNAYALAVACIIESE